MRMDKSIHIDSTTIELTMRICVVCLWMLLTDLFSHDSKASKLWIFVFSKPLVVQLMATTNEKMEYENFNSIARNNNNKFIEYIFFLIREKHVKCGCYCCCCCCFYLYNVVLVYFCFCFSIYVQSSFVQTINGNKPMAENWFCRHMNVW